MEKEREGEGEGEGEEEKQQAKEEKEEEEELLIDALQQLDTRDGRPPYPLLSDSHGDNHPHDHSRERRRRRRVGDEEAVAHSGEPLAPLATEGDAAHQSSSNIIRVCTSAKATTDDENVDDGVMDATVLTGDASAAIDAFHTPAGQSIDDDDDDGGEYDRNQFPTDVVSADSSVVTRPGCGHAYHTAHYSEDGPQSMPPTTNKDDEDGYDPDSVPCSSPDSIPDSSFVETKKLQAFYSDEQRSGSVVSGSPSADGTYYYYSSPKSAARRRPLVRMYMCV